MYNGGVDEYHERNPGQPIVVLEEASTLCTRGEYADDSEKCYVSAYDEHPPDRGTNVWMSAEEWWTYCVARSYLAGGFVWTGFDYGGEPTPYWKWPCIGSNFGMMDICGFPKDNYYYYKSWWSDEVVLHIFPHWNWRGKEGQLIDVRCFSNCDEIEFFVNGKNFGKKKMPRNSHLKWDVEYQSGLIEAKGYKDGKVVAEKKVETTDEPFGIRMIPDRAEIKASQKDICIVNVEVVDTKGRVVPTAENEIQFAVKGNGRIIGLGNGNPTSHEPAKSDRRKAFNGLCQVIVQSTEKAGIIKLNALSKGLQESFFSITSL
jgi:beta-galactosidase